MGNVKPCFSWVRPRIGCIIAAILTVLEGVIGLGAPTMNKDLYRVAVVWCAFSMFAAALLLCGVLQNRVEYFKAYLSLRGCQLFILLLIFVGLILATWAAFVFVVTVGSFKSHKELAVLVLTIISTIGGYTAVHMYLYFVVYGRYKTIGAELP